MLEHKTKKHSLIFKIDHVYSLIMYIVIDILAIGLLLFENDLLLLHQQYEGIYKFLTILLIIFTNINILLILKSKLFIEGIILNLIVSLSIVIFIEKTIIFWLLSNLSIGYYLSYISLTVFHLLFSIYRLFKIKEMLDFLNVNNKILEEHNKKLNS